jgi:hypothetical protein
VQNFEICENMKRSINNNYFLLSSFLLSLCFTIQVKAQVPDTIPPTAICVSNVVTIPMQANGFVVIHAKDFDRGSYDNVTKVDKLKFYFDGDPAKTNFQIRCIDLEAAGVVELPLNLQLWVEDEGGNKASCDLSIIIQDVLDVCQIQVSQTYIKGKVRVENGNKVSLTATLRGPNNFKSEINSADIFLSGFDFYFPHLTKQTGYQLCLDKQDEHLNGISTVDVVRIQRHILGIEYLNSHYKYMAADVNKTKTITSSDITEIRRLILGIKKTFTNVPSWIFVPKDLTFAPNFVPDIKPFIPSCDSIYIGNTSIDNKEYVAIKMGDVSLNAKSDALHGLQTRSQKNTLFYQTATIDKNTIRTDFKLKNGFEVAAFQFTLAFNPNELEFAGIENGNIRMDEEQYSLHDLHNGKIHFAWDRNQLDKSTQTNGALFSITWKRISLNSINPDLSLDPNGIEALCFDNDLNEFNLSLRSTSEDATDIRVFQDFNNQMVRIEGTSYSNSTLNYSIIDITGNTILQNSIQLTEGIFSEEIILNSLPTTGMYFLKVQHHQTMKTWKILKM